MQADLNIDSPILGQQILVRDPDAVRLNVYTPNGWLAVHDFGYMDDMTFDAFIHLWPRLYHLLLTGTWLRESCPYEALHQEHTMESQPKPRDGGKGHAQRPIQDKQKFNDNWDAIFKKTKNDHPGSINTHQQDQEDTCLKP